MTFKKKENGFTLVETIVSVALIGILLVVLCTVMIGNFSMIQRQGETTSLLYIAQQELDHAINDFTYEAQDDRLFITRIPTTMDVDGKSIEGILVEVKDVKESKVILSTFITK